MIRYGIVFLILFSNPAFAANFTNYRATTLDAVINDWDKKTKSEDAGISFSAPEKIRFSAMLRTAPTGCRVELLRKVLQMMGALDLMKQVAISHCVVLTSSSGRVIPAYIQDTLVPAMDGAVKAGQTVDFYADFLAYRVNSDRSKNAPLLLISRFDSK